MDESCSLLQTPTDEDLEALCKLLTGVGRLLDHDKARAYMDKYFEKLLEFSAPQSQFSARIRFLIDVRWHIYIHRYIHRYIYIYQFSARIRFLIDVR